MRKFISNLFAGLLVATVAACGTTNPMYQPQPLAYYPAPAYVPDTASYESPLAHIANAHKGMAILASPTATLEARWFLVAPSDWNPVAQRYDCEIVVRDEFQLIEQVYPCDRVETSGNDYFVYLMDDRKEVRLNLTEIPGGFVTGGFYEQGMLGLPYGNNRGVRHKVVWRSHEPVRGARPQWRGY